MYYAEINSIKEGQSQDQLAVEVQLLRDGITRNWHHLAIGKTGNRISRCGTANSAAEGNWSVHGFLHSRSRTRIGFENQRKLVNVFSNSKLHGKSGISRTNRIPHRWRVWWIDDSDDKVQQKEDMIMFDEQI